MKFTIFIILITTLVLVKSIKYVPICEVFIIERLNKYNCTVTQGLNIVIPFVEKIRAKVSLQQQKINLPPQGIITKDNVSITIAAVIFFQIKDPVKATYEVKSLKRGIQFIAITAIRDIIGKMNLGNVFSSNSSINLKLLDILDKEIDKCGCKVERVEVILNPSDTNTFDINISDNYNNVVITEFKNSSNDNENFITRY